MISVKVTWNNGDTTQTEMNATPIEARNYYLNNVFNIGDGAGGDLLVKAVKVELIDGDNLQEITG